MSDWPDGYNFDTDELCQSVFLPFILGEMKKLKAYDALRPAGIKYIFHEHAERVARDVEKTCLHMRLSEIVARNMYWASLPHDIGKRLLLPNVWDHEEKPDPDGELYRQRRTHTDLGADEIVEKEHGDVKHLFKDLMIDIMRNHHERVDGKGYRGLTAEQLSMPVRLAAIVEAFDGLRIRRPHFEPDRDTSIPGVLKRMREEKAGQFDVELFEAFAEVKMNEFNVLEGPAP
ncbi:MAG: HD domain-containing phosphohydrolase [Alphaproteobacteria bacterium]